MEGGWEKQKQEEVQHTEIILKKGCMFHHMNNITGKGARMFVNNSTSHCSHINIVNYTKKWRRTFWVINEHTRTSNNGNEKRKKREKTLGIDSPFTCTRNLCTSAQNVKLELQ